MVDKFALVPVIGDKEAPWKIGAAFENEKGYNNTTYGGFQTQDEAADFCEMMNGRMGLTDREADLIIISSMQGEKKMSFTLIEVDPEETGFAGKFAVMDGNICMDRFDIEEEAKEALIAYKLDEAVDAAIEEEFDNIETALANKFPEIDSIEMLRRIEEWVQFR